MAINRAYHRCGDKPHSNQNRSWNDDHEGSDYFETPGKVAKPLAHPKSVEHLHLQLRAREFRRARDQKNSG